MKTRLVVYRNRAIDLAFPLVDKRMTIGRGADCSIQLPDETVSRQHGVIVQAPEGWMIENQSKNGILLNGKLVDKAPLKDGDKLVIGSYELYFETNVPSDDWIPSYIINLSSEVMDKTKTRLG